MAASTERYQVITWQRGSHSVVDTKFEIGDPRRRDGVGYKLKREAEAVARRKNRDDPDAKIAEALDQVERAEQALDRNRGKLMEQDYRDILERATGRLLALEEGAPDVR